MADPEEVAMAEARMAAAKASLLEYVEARQRIDAERYRRLVARVKKTETEFMKALAEFGGQESAAK